MTEKQPSFFKFLYFFGNIMEKNPFLTGLYSMKPFLQCHLPIITLQLIHPKKLVAYPDNSKLEDLQKLRLGSAQV